MLFCLFAVMAEAPIENPRAEIDSIDAFPDTPVLDIKPWPNVIQTTRDG